MDARKNKRQRIFKNKDYERYYIGFVEEYNKTNKYTQDLIKTYETISQTVSSEYETQTVKLKNGSVYSAINRTELTKLIQTETGKKIKGSLKKYVAEKFNDKFRVLSFFKQTTNRSEPFYFVFDDGTEQSSLEWNSYYVIL